jgi:hypothetical protein
MEVSGGLHVRLLFSRGKILGVHIGGWVGPRASLDAVARTENPTPCRELNPYFLAHKLVIILFGKSTI